MEENKVVIKKSEILAILAIISSIFLVFALIARIYKGITFETECYSHIKNASNACSVELASAELEKAIIYAEKNQLTCTTTKSETESDSIRFWYQNLKTAKLKLDTFEWNTSETNYFTELQSLQMIMKNSTPPFLISIANSGFKEIYIFSWIFTIMFWATFQQSRDNDKILYQAKTKKSKPENLKTI